MGTFCPLTPWPVPTSYATWITRWWDCCTKASWSLTRLSGTPPMAAPDVVATRTFRSCLIRSRGRPVSTTLMWFRPTTLAVPTDDMTNGAYGWSSTNTAVATLPTRTLHTVAVGTTTGATHIQLQSYVRPSCRRTFTIRSSRLPSAPPRTAHRPH